MVSASDRELLEKWRALDRFHRPNVTPELLMIDTVEAAEETVKAKLAAKKKLIEEIQKRPFSKVRGLFVSPLSLAIKSGEVSQHDVTQYIRYQHRPKIAQRSDGLWVIFDQPKTPFWYATFNSWRDAGRAWLLWEEQLARRD